MHAPARGTCQIPTGPGGIQPAEESPLLQRTPRPIRNRAAISRSAARTYGGSVPSCKLRNRGIAFRNVIVFLSGARRGAALRRSFDDFRIGWPCGADQPDYVFFQRVAGFLTSQIVSER